MERNKDEDLRQIREEVELLVDSPLYQYRKENNYVPVVGVGNHDAKVMFVGEAPGRKEAETGQAFVGSAGKILDKLLDSVKLTREEVYITSIVKDRPPKNRDPLPEEIAIYVPFLDRQIEAIRPAVIVTLGRFAMQYIMKRYGLDDKLAPIGDLHGQIFTADMPWGYKINILPLYHPAAVIYNRSLKTALEEDFKVLKTLL